MAKKKATKVIEQPIDEPIGHINISINSDGSYDLDTKINPNSAALAIYAQILTDLMEGRINLEIIKVFASSEESVNQQIAQFLALYITEYKKQDEPLISPDRVFRKVKQK